MQDTGMAAVDDELDDEEFALLLTAIVAMI